jgi:hypothetical protein
MVIPVLSSTESLIRSNTRIKDYLSEEESFFGIAMENPPHEE